MLALWISAVGFCHALRLQGLLGPVGGPELSLLSLSAPSM